MTGECRSARKMPMQERSSFAYCFPWFLRSCFLLRRQNLLQTLGGRDAHPTAGEACPERSRRNAGATLWLDAPTVRPERSRSQGQPFVSVEVSRHDGITFIRIISSPTSAPRAATRRWRRLAGHLIVRGAGGQPSRRGRQPSRHPKPAPEWRRQETCTRAVRNPTQSTATEGV